MHSETAHRKVTANWHRKGLLTAERLDDNHHHMYQPPGEHVLDEIRRRQKFRPRRIPPAKCQEQA